MSNAKVVLVTGATSGIGKETAKLLASQGWKVVFSGRRVEAGEAVEKEIKSQGGEAVFVKNDISSEESARGLVEKTVEIFGRIDGAVNNAAVAVDGALIADSSTEKFQEMINTNILGVFWCMKYQIKQMLVQKSGSIVNVSSMAGVNGVSRSGTYSATKHAVVGLTKSAALDYGDTGIRINAIAPGAIKTELLQNAFDAGVFTESQVAEMFPLKRIGAPIDIAKGISFLLDNDYTTGAILSVDGGLNAK